MIRACLKADSYFFKKNINIYQLFSLKKKYLPLFKYKDKHSP